jgi:hypothetical protein
MNDYAEMAVGDHGSIYIEVTPATREAWQEAGFPEVHERLKMEFNRVMDTVRTTALGFLDGLNAMEEIARPDEATLEFGLTFGGEAGVAIKASSEAALKVSLTWRCSRDTG